MSSSQTKHRWTRWPRLLLCCAALLGLLAANASAIYWVTAELRPDFTIIIDGAERTFYNASDAEVQPILYNGTTYLPVRAIGELMGKNVDWNQTTKTVTLSGARTTPATAGTPDDTAVRAEVSAELRDDFTVIVDGSVRTFSDANGSRVYPLLYQGSTYLPIRAIGELMGKSVDWDQATRTVTLSSSLVTDADTFSGGEKPSGTQPATQIALEDARAAALTHAGLTADQVTFTKQKLDRDDGVLIYEIEFYTAGGVEYEYEIDASTGNVLSFESDLGYTKTDGTPVTTAITQARAQEIALGQVSGASASHVTKCKVDHDDGHLCYEVEIVYDCLEYEFEIDGSTGTILSSDCDVIPCDHAHHSGRQHHSGGHH